jgi:hypothetical protein
MTIQASAAVATANSPPAVKTAQAKINAALSTPGATGMKGFLIWVRSAWPKSISDPIIKAAAQHLAATQAAGAASPAGTLGAYQKASVGLVPYPRRAGSMPRPSQATIARRAGLGRYSGRTTFGSWDANQRRAGMGRLGLTGNTGALTVPITVGATSPAGSTATVAATPSSAAGTNWAQTISGAVNSAVGAYVGVTQAQDAQTLFNTNLVRAQQGLAPIGANPSAVGIIPTASTTTMIDLGPILLIGGAIAALAILSK